MTNESRAAKLMVLLLRPIARFCLVRGLRLSAAYDAMRQAFLTEGRLLLEQRGDKVNVSRLSAATGLHRQEIAKLTEGADLAASSARTLDVVSRVISLWQTDPRFATGSGKPRQLTISGADALFPVLTGLVSKDTNAGTILYELERSGHIERRGNSARLLRGSYTPEEDAVAGFSIVARDMNDLLTAASENIEHSVEDGGRNLHARTEFDRVRADKLPEIRAWLITEGHRLHRAIREYLSSHDQDTAPEPHFTGDIVKISFTTFSLVERKSILRKASTKARSKPPLRKL